MDHMLPPRIIVVPSQEIEVLGSIARLCPILVMACVRRGSKVYVVQRYLRARMTRRSRVRPRRGAMLDKVEDGSPPVLCVRRVGC